MQLDGEGRVMSVAPFLGAIAERAVARSASMGQVMPISKRSVSSLHTVAGHVERVYSVAEGATPLAGTWRIKSLQERLGHSRDYQTFATGTPA